MNRILISVFFLIILTNPGVSNASEHKLFKRMDVFELEWVSNPQISPDGHSVVYNRNSMDVMKDSRASRLWVVNADGSSNFPLTGRDVSETNAVWSPDGSRIAFTSATDNGSEIYVYWLATGKTARLTQLQRSPSGLSWAPDGQQLAFSMLVPEKPPVLVTPPKKPDDAKWADTPRVTTRLKYERDGSGYIETGYKHYFVIPALGGSPRQVTTGTFHHTGTPQWSVNGKALFFSGNRNDDWEHDFANSEIYRVNIDTGNVIALTDRSGPDRSPVISPDGKKIAYLGFEDKVRTYQLTKLHVMNIDGSDKREVLSKFDRSISGLAWNKESSRIYFQYDEHGDTKIAVTTLAGKSQDIATNLGGTAIGRPYGGGSFSVAPAGQIAFTHVTPYRPAELALIEARSSKVDVVTSFNKDILDWRDLGKVEEVWYKSSLDGRDIQGWTVKPPGFDPSKKYPLLVENHGGPISNYGARFSPEIQLYAAAGYVVFYPNPRGSTGYGEEFGDLLYNNYPGDDYQDVMDGVDMLIKNGIAHEDNLYVTGGSAGGIMTAWIVGKNTRFRAAAVIKPIMNWMSKTLTADNYYGYANYRYLGQPWENIEGYMKFSPISLIANVETPTLVMVGTADMRTPISEAKQMYNALKIRGIDTALVEVPGAFHNIAARPSQLITKIDHILAWFKDYQLPDSTVIDQK
jgi:dipeptidyl aminopeptidase/acylaminoacyl peptidase